MSFDERCLDGFVSFRQGEDFMGFSFYEGYAQFYTVSEDDSAQEFLSVLEPFDGTLDDCGGRRAIGRGDLARADRHHLTRHGRDGRRRSWRVHGEFTVPAELACHLSPQDSVALVLMRTDRALVTTEDGRNVIVTAEVSNRLSVTLQ